MSRRSKTSPAPSAVLPAKIAPAADDALGALFRRNVRAVVSLVVRLVAVGVLLTLLERQILWVGRNRLPADAIGSTLVLWPFYTALGRIAAWRIALGRAYVREERWIDAERTLLPFGRYRYQPFDAAGEGGYWLARALRARGRGEDARHLLRCIVKSRRGLWHDKAEVELAEGADRP